MLKLSKCPACGSSKIKAVRRDLKRTFQSKPYTVPSVAFHECKECGEHVYDRAAMRKIQAHSPAYSKKQSHASSI